MRNEIMPSCLPLFHWYDCSDSLRFDLWHHKEMLALQILALVIQIFMAMVFSQHPIRHICEIDNKEFQFSTACGQRVCSVRAACVQHACNVWAACGQCMCSRPVCSRCAACVQRACSVRAACAQRACSGCGILEYT